MDPCEVLPKNRKIAFEVGETSSSIISKNDYEVFLSFRGPDTRQGLTDCLYHALIDAGIRVFRDDDELALGDKIDEILTALDNSQICVVVLSPTFAESAWCLREVERMVGMKKDIVPIFCHVSTDDVKLKTELYANASAVHENKYGKEQVQKWREALKEIPTIKGRALKNTGFIEFSRKIAKEILTKLKVKHKYEIDNFVQVEDEVEAALKLLDTGSGGCRFLAIHGMGGIGKTTLAKSIFNQISDNFDCSCFLENIEEILSQGGLQKLQEQLLRSIDPSLRDAAHIVDAIGKIKNNFTRKKVLIVLDDIDHKNHIRDFVGSFGSGSRIIFTSRNAELHEQRTSYEAHFYGLEKKEMNSKQALKLFSRHAFGEDSPPKDFESLSAEAISTTGGLPLALEVVGSFLHRRKAKVWRDMIKKLKEAPHQDVQARLKISYNALDDEQQEIFLDIACFFIGEEKRNAVYMWEACELDPIYGIEVLISMSLIKLKEKQKWSYSTRAQLIKLKQKKCFWMHDQLRDLGRAIVKVNSKDTRAGSRLWMHKDALALLKTNVGKEKVEALHLDGLSDSLDHQNFVGLDKLRYIRLTEHGDLGGDFSGLIPNLRWLSLSLRYASSFIVTNLCLRELVILELYSIRFDENWQGWGQILISKQLKVLTLSCCNELISMPVLSKIVNLERLVLEWCDNLTSIHSIGELVKLKHLSLRYSRNLRVLPDSIGDLRSLISLDLWVSGIIELPSTIGRLAKLESLCLAWCKNLRRLPDSIVDLHSLINLDMSGSSIDELPHSFGNLASLQKLNLSDSGVSELPSTIGRLAKLESLCLAWCKNLQRLPNSIGNLHSLIDLDMSATSIDELPHSFGNLASLQKLDLTNSRVRSLPHSFRGLEKLERLNLGRKFCLRADWIGELHGLPSGLTWLNVHHVKKIQNLSNLINLSELEIDNTCLFILVVLEGIEKLIKLKRLAIKCCNVNFLSMEWGALQQLKSLKLDCSSLEFGQCQLPCSLESLDLKVKEWGQLPINLSCMKNLSELKLFNFLIEEADAVQELELLEVLEMRYCILKFNDFPVLKRLRYLCINRCLSHMRASPDHVIGSEFQIKLSNLKNLLKLRLTAVDVDEYGLPNLSVTNPPELRLIVVDADGLDDLASGLDSLELPKNLSELDLRRFSIHDDGFKVEGLESLVDLKMYECIIYEFGNVSVLKSLTSLRILLCSFPTMTCLDIPPQLDRLVQLTIRHCSGIVDIQGIGKLKSLTALDISDCESLRRIEDISELNGPADIKISDCKKFEGIDGVDKLLSAGTLSRLKIEDCECENIRYPHYGGEDGGEDDSEDVVRMVVRMIVMMVVKMIVRMISPLIEASKAVWH